MFRVADVGCFPVNSKTVKAHFVKILYFIRAIHVLKTSLSYNDDFVMKLVRDMMCLDPYMTHFSTAGTYLVPFESIFYSCCKFPNVKLVDWLRWPQRQADHWPRSNELRMREKVFTIHLQAVLFKHSDRFFFSHQKYQPIEAKILCFCSLILGPTTFMSSCTFEK